MLNTAYFDRIPNISTEIIFTKLPWDFYLSCPKEKLMKVADIREKFLKFFEAHSHTIVRSSSLVPGNDPTLLFTNSGMVQFKEVFLGFETKAYRRATTAQRCVRAGGKHNDLENVGYTARHHTFFEMLGNFSFGDYFKRDAIRYAWELLTNIYQLPKEKLWITVYQEDDEAYAIWANEIGVPEERIIRIGDNKGARYASDNFWQMADTGPCGPCSEIFYDHGPEVQGGPPGSPDEDGDRYIEIWNLVFMQFVRDEQGNLSPLPKPCVDTGMGLERIAAILQGVHSNYEIDLFQHLIEAAARETSTTTLNHNSLKVIADHIRACAFLIVDGVVPSSEGRGYVLRRIIRRAIRHGYKLGCRQSFFYKLIPDLLKEMGGAYPELTQAKQKVMDILRQEEERFFETIENGMEALEKTLANLQSEQVLEGEFAFKLHDTYGFPLDLTADICRERNIKVDEAAFDSAMAKQKQQARAAGKFKTENTIEYTGAPNNFCGYETLDKAQATVLALYTEGSSVEQISAGQNAIVVLDTTPFYAESGGQVGDQGRLLLNDGAYFHVTDTQKIQPNVFGHHGQLQSGQLQTGQTVHAQVDVAARLQTMRHHSATHLMHKALRDVLGAHVQQKGSLVDAQKTRFDFSHHAALSKAEILQVEKLVNAQILQNAITKTRLMSFDEAVKGGAMALFGEKYSDEVRVLDIGFSRELCGGTHIASTGEIGLFKIIMETGVAAGVRRIEAIAGEQALAYVQKLEEQMSDAAALLKAQPSELSKKILQLQDKNKELEKAFNQLKARDASQRTGEIVASAIDVAGIQLLVTQVSDVDAKGLRDMLDQIKQSLKKSVIVLASVDAEKKVNLIAGVSEELTPQIHAGQLIHFVAQQMGSRGGGRADMAQAGGGNVESLSTALKSVKDWVVEKL